MGDPFSLSINELITRKSGEAVASDQGRRKLGCCVVPQAGTLLLSRFARNHGFQQIDSTLVLRKSPGGINKSNHSGVSAKGLGCAVPEYPTTNVSLSDVLISMNVHIFAAYHDFFVALPHR